jgi:hypothetical protein
VYPLHLLRRSACLFYLEIWKGVILGERKFKLSFDIPGKLLFDRILSLFRKEGFRVEEADRVELIVRLEKNSTLGFLFGIGNRRIIMDFDPEDTGCSVFVRVKGGVVLEERVKDELERLALLIKKSIIRRAEEKKASLVPAQVIIREIVRIPCPYCGSLIDNTLSRCTQCGGELKWS